MSGEPNRPPLRDHRPGSAGPQPSSPVHERCPRIRPTAGCADPRIAHTSPGPDSGSPEEPERSFELDARQALACTVVVGQLWGLTVVVAEWMKGDTGNAWSAAAFVVLSFLVVLGLWSLAPKDR